MKRVKIDNTIGDEGAKAISESLKINTLLTILDLHCDENIWNEKWLGNGIGKEGARAISYLLKNNTSLTMLDLYSEIKWEMKWEMERNEMRNE